MATSRPVNALAGGPLSLRPEVSVQARDRAPDDEVHELGVNLFPREPATVEERPKQSGGNRVAVSG